MRTEAARKATNVSLPRHLVAEAKELGISLSRACERGLSEEIADARTRRWQEENRAGIAAWNAHVEAEGLPLARFRSF